MKSQFIILCLLSGIFFIELNVNGSYSSKVVNFVPNTLELPQTIDHSISYLPRSPISIDGDIEFVSWVNTNKIPGEGSMLNPFILRNYEIESTDGSSGIIIKNTKYVFNIEDCKVSGTTGTTKGGIHIENVSNVKILGNYAIDNELGYYIKDSTRCLFSSNQATNNSWLGFRCINSNSTRFSLNRISNHGAGIFLEDSTNIQLEENVINLGLEGIYVINVNKSRFNGNIITNFNIGIKLEHSSLNEFDKNQIENCSTVGVWTQWCYDGNEFFSNHLENTGNTGFHIGDHSNHTILTSNYVTNCDEAIDLDFSNYCDISSNILIENINLGIWVRGSNHNTVVNNTVHYNHFAGVQLNAASNNTLTDNSFSYNYLHGLYADNIENTIITGNSFIENGDRGLDIENCKRIHVSNNVIQDNSELGLLLYYTPFSTVHHNTFVNNGDFQAWDNNETNEWFFLFEGNYWSDHPTLDVNLDGISEIPYQISGGVLQDKYPLTPSLFASSDYAISEGQLGEFVEWWHTYRVPYPYEIRLNNLPYSFGSLLPGFPIKVSLNSMPLGTNELFLNIMDPMGISVTDSIMIDVIDNTLPEIQAAIFSSFTSEDLEKILSWTAFDLHPEDYRVFVNGISSEAGIWESGEENHFTLETQIPGVYNITINVKDSSSNVQTHTCFVLVELSSQTSSLVTTEESSINTGNNTPGFGFNQLLLTLGIIYLIIRKKRR